MERLGGCSLFSRSVATDSFVTPWTVAHQAPLSMGFPSQEYWHIPSPGDLPNPGIEPTSPVLAGGFFSIEPPGKPSCGAWWGVPLNGALGIALMSRCPDTCILAVSQQMSGPSSFLSEEGYGVPASEACLRPCTYSKCSVSAHQSLCTAPLSPGHQMPGTLQPSGQGGPWCWAACTS